MKRKLPLIITFMLALVIAFTAAACNSYGSVPVQGDHDKSYAVLSNGGSAVQYGKYVYFINGFRGFEDENAKSNTFGKVEKGAIYRAELLGEDVTRRLTIGTSDVDIKTFAPVRDFNTGYSIKTTTTGVLKGYEKDADGNYLKDDDDEYVEIREDKEFADVQLIAPKTVGTSANSNGGIFIFDDYIFYASPNNKRDNKGVTQTQKTDFFRAKLDGTKTELIYTSKNDTTASPYTFYKFDGAYYLVVQDGDKAISVKMDKKVREPVTIGEGVTKLYLPNKGVYYQGIAENTVEDFVYLVRNTMDGDPSRLGDVLEVKRPDGSNSHIISASGKNSTIHGSSNGIFFYEVGGTIKYTNLAEIVNGLLPEDYSGEWADITLPDGVRRVGGELGFGTAGYNAYKFLSLSARHADDIYVLATNASGLFKLDRMGNARLLHDAEATFVGVQQNYAYFTAAVGSSGAEGSNLLFRVDMFLDGRPEAILNTDNISSDVAFKYDILPDFAVYFAQLDTDAPDYTFFKELEDLSAEGLFVGYRIADETIPEADLHPDSEADKIVDNTEE